MTQREGAIIVILLAIGFFAFGSTMVLNAGIHPGASENWILAGWITWVWSLPVGLAGTVWLLWCVLVHDRRDSSR